MEFANGSRVQFARREQAFGGGRKRPVSAAAESGRGRGGALVKNGPGCDRGAYATRRAARDRSEIGA